MKQRNCKKINDFTSYCYSVFYNFHVTFYVMYGLVAVSTSTMIHLVFSISRSLFFVSHVEPS